MFGCHAVLVESSLLHEIHEIMNLQIQVNNLMRPQGYGKRALGQADEEFFWSSGNILEIKIIPNILVCLSLMIIA